MRKIVAVLTLGVALVSCTPKNPATIVIGGDSCGLKCMGQILR